MSFKLLRTSFSISLKLFGAAFLVGVLLFGFWITRDFVSAYLEVKEAHVFGTAVSGEGWRSVDQALTQDLSSQAPFGSFSSDNSAYVVVGERATSTQTQTEESTVSENEEDDSEVVEESQTETESEASGADSLPEEESDTENQTENESSVQEEEGESQDSELVELGDSDAEDTEVEISTSTEPTLPVDGGEENEVSQEEVVGEELPEDNETGEEVLEEGEESSAAHFLAPLANHAGAFAKRIASGMVRVAVATTTGNTPESEEGLQEVQEVQEVIASSTPEKEASTVEEPEIVQEEISNEDDVALCSVLGKDCYTIEVAGFGVDGALKEKEFQGAKLSFSFASLAAENAITDDKLLVRYFHGGEWRYVGEIFLNKEISNLANGGYFTNTLENIEAWDDLADVRVVLEYDRGEESGFVELYLDSVWIDVEYKDRPQDVLSGDDANPDDVPENIIFDLAKEGAGSVHTLAQPDGTYISFPYVDASAEGDVVVRVDRDQYKTLATTTGSSADEHTVYVSVTNNSSASDRFYWYTAFAGGGSVRTISQWLKNVPQEVLVPTYEDVTYFCESGWQHGSSTTPHICLDTQEERQCSRVSDTGENCLVEGVLVENESQVQYESAWTSLPVGELSGGASGIVDSVPEGFAVTNLGQQSFTVLPDQTVYFEFVVQTPAGTDAEFAFYAVGNASRAEVHSNNLELREEVQKDEEDEKEVKKKKGLNDQLSSKSSFDGTELPAFRFKFKSQRGFFTRVRDTVLGVNTPFSVEGARLRHASGEIERVPVEIEYNENDEWTLRLQKHPRAFRPGKYSIELTVKEGTETYEDVVDFYWGVLAVNTDKSVYEPGEEAFLTMAALDDSGNTICGATLELVITDPTGTTIAVPVGEGGGCGPNNVTDIPDYIAHYTASTTGEYHIDLTHLDGSEVLHFIEDSFEVRENVPFSVKRTGPTRIYPLAPYIMEIEVVANQSFQGTIAEVLPEGFEVVDPAGGTFSRKDGVLTLSWDVSLAQGETRTFRYTFDAPDVSPYLYILGPLSFINGQNTTLFEESRTWKIASDAVAVAAGVAWLTGDQTTNGTDLNESTAYAFEWNLDGEYDATYYAHSTTTNAHQLTVNVDGDYLIALTMPMERTDGNNSRTRIEAEVRVNGVAQQIGVGRSSYIRNQGGQAESSNHIHVLLENLTAGDYIEVFTQAVITADAGDNVIISTQANLYAEYIASTETVFAGTATTTTSGTNLNPSTAAELLWFDSREDSGYTHDNATNAQDITLDEIGEYLVFINLPLNSSVQRANVRGRVLLDGSVVDGGNFKQGYIRNQESDSDSSIHWSGVVRTTSTNQVLSVDVAQEATAGTVTIGSDLGSIYVQRLPSTDVYIGRGNDLTGGTNWNVGTAQSIEWETDDVIDAGVFTHSTTTNPHQITVDQDGDYFLAYNDSLTGGSGRANNRITVEVNGSPVSGAQTKTHYRRSASGHDEHSGSLVFLLRDLTASDIITLSTQQEGAGGTINDDEDAILLLWRKEQQSSFIQNTYRWYANEDAQTPTDPWPVGGNDLDEDEAITTGNASESGDVHRLRMSLQVDSNTIAGADAFKIQYAPGSTCSPALSWTDIGAIASGEVWRAYDNASVSAGSTLSSTLLSASDVAETYEEGNPSAVTPNGMTTSQDGEWDWVIENNSAPEGTDYCFRMVSSDGQLLKEYVIYPQLVTNAVPETPALSKLFDNEKVASTSPWFEFSTSDDNSEDLHYEIQIDDDYGFGSPIMERNSETHFGDFENVNTPADKSPFTSGQTIRFKSNETLTNGTTYYWRVRARDPSGTDTYSGYSSVRSFTVDATVSVSTWFQTAEEQFDTNALDTVDATTGDDVEIIGANPSGTMLTTLIDYDDKDTGNAWGEVSWNDTETNGTITYQVQYFSATSTWVLIPDTEIPDNSTGTSTSPIQLSTLDTETYNQIRVKANFTRGSGTPVLHDVTVSWALTVAAPTLDVLFDNEKTSTTTPSFEFVSTDPHGDDLVYQVEWSTDPTFAAGVTTRTSDTHSGFENIDTPADTSPFTEGENIRFTVQAGDVLTNGTTYWWRVRARDPSGGNAYSLWSSSRSFTVDTAVTVSTWFQTTTEQFDLGALVRTVASSDEVQVSTTLGEVAIYREATATDAITTSNFDHGWDTTVRQDSSYNLSGGSNIELQSGYYAVMYGSRFDTTSSSNRSEIQTHLNLDGSDVPIGWSQGYIRRSSGADEAFTSGGGIIKVEDDDDALVLRTFRTDVNGAGVQREPNASSIQLIRLEDSWDYIRLGKDTTQIGPNSTSWVDVTYDRQDEIDTASFTHATGSSAVTIKDAGHYLVFANTYGAIGANDRTEVIQKLTLNDVDVEGSYTTVYIRGNQNSETAYEGAASIGMIIETTASNQILNVETSRGDGTTAWTINQTEGGGTVDRTALTIARLPDADFIRLEDSGNDNMNPASLSAMGWDIEREEDTSFTHDTVTNNSRIQLDTDDDYLFFTSLYADNAAVVRAVYNQGWRVNGGSLETIGQTGGYDRNSGANDVGNWSGTIFENMTSGDYIEVVTQALGGAGTVAADNKGIQGVRIGSLSEADTRPITIQSPAIVFSDGTGPKWDEFSWNDTEPGGSSIDYQVYYLTASSTYELIPDGDLPDNSTGTSTSPIDLGSIDASTYSTLRVQASFNCASGTCPTLQDWTVNWSEGITVSGTAQEYDESTNVTSGTVAVAVNNTLQVGKTGTISGGVWSIDNVTVFPDDIVTVFIDGAANANEAVAITKYDGGGDITGMKLYERHVVLGSDDNPTLTNADLGQYDVDQDEDVFHDVDAGNDLNACAISGCEDVELFIDSTATYRPDGTSSGDVETHDIEINGTVTADGNTIRVGGSWDNNSVFNSDTGALIFTQTSGSETIDSTGATTDTFNNVTFGENFGSATWSLASTFDVDGNTTISYGTLNQGTELITLGDDLTVNSSGVFAYGTASTTFDGSGTSTWTDNTSPKQNMGDVFIDGATKTLLLGSAVRANNITIGADDTLNVNNNYGVEVEQDWTNNNAFLAQNGTVTFTASTTGRTITPGSSSFYNLTFNGVDGNWSFAGSNVTATNDFTIATGTVTLASATTTVGGSFANTGGTFMHNNGEVLLNGSVAETIETNSSDFYDLVFSGTGSWSFVDTNATSSRNTSITTGSVTLPSGTLAVGGSFTNSATLSHNSGILRFTGAGTETVTLGGSDAYDLAFAGPGSWSFTDTNATSTNTISFESGATTLPSGVFAVGGSWNTSGGIFTHNSGEVKFNSGDTGETVNPGASSFYDLSFNNGSGGWTVTSNATSTNNAAIVAANDFTLASGQTLEVGGTFTNSVGGSGTTWDGSTLTLTSGTSYSTNAKTVSAEYYENLIVGANTDVSMWNSVATTTSVNASGSLYSQDHAGVDGDLYIWGDYTSQAGEYWSYANDFDGTNLSGGNQRQANVRVANGGAVTVASNSLLMVGDSTASTTVENQGSGSYAFNVSTDINAQYYAIKHTDANGLNISGTPTVTSLSNGDFELSVTSGGTMLTLASTTVDANTELQIFDVRFATSSGVTGGNNVTLTDTPASYWWFRDHYGNFDGEANDSDPGGNPGNIRFDDSGFDITVSGNVYANAAETVSAVCDDSTPVVRIVVDGGASHTGSCNSGDGSYSISGVQFSGDVVLTVYLDTNGGERATTITRTPTADITDLHLYERELILRHEDVQAFTIANAAVYDNSDDTDLIFTAATGTPDTLSVEPENELHIWDSKTFTPNGNITLNSGGSGDARDGRFHVGTSSTFIAAGTESHSIGGGFLAQTGSAVTPASSTVIFTATTTGKVISSVPALSLYNVTFNGASGEWSLDSTTTTTVENNFVVTAGSLVGTGDIVVQAGSLTGAGTVAMTGGEVRLEGTGSLGGALEWQFNDLTLGSGTTDTTTKVGVGTTTISGVLTVSANQTLEAGSSPWVLSGGGTPFVVNGTFDAQTAPFTYNSASAANIADETYGTLTLAPSGAGSPTYTLQGGTLSANDLIIGDGTNAVTVTADTNDPSITVSNDITINGSSTLIASNVGALNVSGSWTNLGAFTHSNGLVTFDSSSAGNTISPGTSAFYDLTFDNASGGWTITEHATSTNDFSLTNASSFAVATGQTLEVGGTFTNSVGGSATDWDGSTLKLTSGTSYPINTRSDTGDDYDTLTILPNTDVTMWYSQATTTTVDASSSLYSQDHANQNGDLYIWGDYVRSSGSDYWSYTTDFDGTDISGGPRAASIYIASGASVTLSGGILDILGTTTASTTIQNQGSGNYGFNISGGTVNASYYSVRNTDASGINFSGTPTVTDLSNGDFELDVTSGGTMMTVAGTVIDANPLKVFAQNRFATSSGVTGGSNVTATGSSVSSWKFNLHYGNYDGEALDDDAGGDPGFILWDDSASDITISGNVYSDEGITVSSVCDDSTPVVRLRVEGAGSYTSSCNSSTGLYSISSIFFNPGDVLTVYLDTAGGVQAANVSVDPQTNISDMHLYENRVIVRHEDTAPLTILNMSVYDSSDDSDIPFTATDAATDTLVLPPENKLIVWNGKTFAPAGNVTLNSGGSGNAWDGTLELNTNATFSAAGTQSHSVGGSLIVGTGATLAPASSTFTLTATTTGKTITPSGSSFYDLVFNGTGGNWAFAGGNATTTNDLTITDGTVTLPTGTMTVGGSFDNTGGTFMHNNGSVVLTSTASGETIEANDSDFYDLTFNGSGGEWTFTDSAATTTNDFVIVSGSTILPSSTFNVGGSFENSGGTFNANGNSITLFATASGKNIQGNGSAFNELIFDGLAGEWTFLDANATTTSSFTITNGAVTLPTGMLEVGGSFVSAGTFTNSNGSVVLNSSSTGNTISPGTSAFYDLTFDNASGGWTITEHATSTNDFSLTNASSFAVATGQTLEVGGTFTNSVGGSATDWDGSTLKLTSGTSYPINTRSDTGDDYDTLTILPNTDVTMWYSQATTTTVDASSSLYSQDHANQNGDLYIWGDYVRSSGSDYWSYTTDFDGTDISGSPRQVDVYVATSSSVTHSGGMFEMVGASGFETTVQNTGDTGSYSFDISGGTVNFQYYAFRNLDSTGLNFTGAPTVTSLDNGDFELSVVSGGTLITVASTTVDANASKQIFGTRFATSTGVTSGDNVTLSGTPVGAWNFKSGSGNLEGEAYDVDGGDNCGFIRWDDSACLFVTQEHFRWRNDDGGEGVPTDDWYNASWDARQKVAISNPNASSYTNLPVQIVVDYDADMQTDFDDLRFTDSSGTTTIDYWIESYVSSASSTVWVELPNLPASGSADIYMYYGNASVGSAADGSAVFEFFDDFEDDNITEYSGDTSLFDVDTTFNHNGTYGLDAGPNVDQKTTNGIYQTGSLVGQGETIRFFQYMDATEEDESCTLFGVQGSGQNYAVCLDQYPTEKVVIAEDVTSNDGSGSELASTTVTYATGWYEVEIDWLTDNSINVTVYDDTGAEFASTTATDSSYSSGGVGFSYWFQHGGWDFYSSREYVASDPTYVFGIEQTDGGATWAAAEDAAITGVAIGDDVRLRFSIQNSGTSIYSQQFRLQYASKGAAASCEAVPFINYNDVPNASGCGSSHACMVASAQFTDQTATTPLLSYPAAHAFNAGRMVEDPSNQTASTSVETIATTEVEYALELTASASSDAYCFRTTNGGLDLDNYSKVAEINLSFPPVLSAFSLNNDIDIALTEGATTTIMATSTVTDLNGYADLISATSTIYRSGVGSTCTADENNCYQVPAPQCSFTDCSGNECTLQCSADIQYIADATDVGSAYAAENWLADLAVEDSTGLRDTVTTATVELLTLYGLSVDTNIDFGSLEVGQDTGATNEQTTVTNTGNAQIDIQLQGTDLSGTGSTINVGEQKYATTTFTYASCTICGFLTGSATNVEVDLPKPTSTSTPITDDIYWGINIPSGTKALPHSGLNTFWATSD